MRLALATILIVLQHAAQLPCRSVTRAITPASPASLVPPSSREDLEAIIARNREITDLLIPLLEANLKAKSHDLNKRNDLLKVFPYKNAKFRKNPVVEHRPLPKRKSTERKAPVALILASELRQSGKKGRRKVQKAYFIQNEDKISSSEEDYDFDSRRKSKHQSVSNKNEDTEEDSDEIDSNQRTTNRVHENQHINKARTSYNTETDKNTSKNNHSEHSYESETPEGGYEKKIAHKYNEKETSEVNDYVHKNNQGNGKHERANDDVTEESDESDDTEKKEYSPRINFNDPKHESKQTDRSSSSENDIVIKSSNENKTSQTRQEYHSDKSSSQEDDHNESREVEENHGTGGHSSSESTDLGNEHSHEKQYTDGVQRSEESDHSKIRGDSSEVQEKYGSDEHTLSETSSNENPHKRKYDSEGDDVSNSGENRQSKHHNKDKHKLRSVEISSSDYDSDNKYSHEIKYRNEGQKEVHGEINEDKEKHGNDHSSSEYKDSGNENKETKYKIEEEDGNQPVEHKESLDYVNEEVNDLRSAEYNDENDNATIENNSRVSNKDYIEDFEEYESHENVSEDKSSEQSLAKADEPTRAKTSEADTPSVDDDDVNTIEWIDNGGDSIESVESKTLKNDSNIEKYATLSQEIARKYAVNSKYTVENDKSLVETSGELASFNAESVEGSIEVLRQNDEESAENKCKEKENIYSRRGQEPVVKSDSRQVHKSYKLSFRFNK